MIRRIFRSGLWWLVAGALAIASCSGARETLPAAQTLKPPSGLAVTPQLTLTPERASPEAALSPTQTPTLLTLTPWPSQTPTPTTTLTPTIIPTGMTLDAGYSMQNGQNPYSAVVQYKDMAGLSHTQAVHFLLYFPESYGKDPAKKWPLMIYLHGSGSRGSQIGIVRQYLLPKTLDSRPDFPFIVLSPQCPGDVMTWSNQIDALNALLDLVIAGYKVDTQRIYATGFSMGGFGAWEFALRYPQRFAAIAPVAGGYIFGSSAIPANLCDLKKLHVWVFHGDQDTTVPPVQDISLVTALRACGGNVQFTYYKGADHGETAAQAYADERLYTWFAAQKNGFVQ